MPWGITGARSSSPEAVEDPLRALDTALGREGVEPARFRPLRPGEALDVPEEVPE